MGDGQGFPTMFKRYHQGYKMRWWIPFLVVFVLCGICMNNHQPELASMWLQIAAIYQLIRIEKTLNATRPHDHNYRQNR